MSQARKYLFDNDFAHPEEMQKQKAVHTEDELAAAKAEAFEAGRAAMAEEQRVTDEQVLAQLIERMARQTEALLSARHESEDKAVRDAGDLAITICRKILPTLASQNALTEIEGLVIRTITEMHEEPRLVLRVADSKLDELQARFERMTAAFQGKLVLIGDDDLDATDCEVLWADGGVERDFSRLWSEIEHALAALTDGRTEPEPISPLQGLPDPADGTLAPSDRGNASADALANTPLTETANQESGHG